MGVIDKKTGKEIIKPIYNGIEYFSDSVAMVEITQQGKIIPPKYDFVDYYSKEKKFVKVRIGGKWGLVDRQTGKELSSPIYDYIGRLVKD